MGVWGLEEGRGESWGKGSGAHGAEGDNVENACVREGSRAGLGTRV